ncbi:Serine/threonine protein kinase [Pseudozyma hubeiensis]|nr:Serine/threonine protein kinase [Pseudozyma hubeiensis]
MDNALQSLTNTLDAINSRQAAARKRARKGADATPFTSAVLNREGLEIYTYIRDADHRTEASLFWYPPLPQSASTSRAGPSATRSAHVPNARVNGADDANEADLLLAPRLPEPRQVQPPTPLRNQNTSNKQSFQSQNEQSVDPRVLLLAAQRLNDTCGKGSRTRKHIRGLIKTHAMLNEDIKNYEKQIRQSEADLRATADGKPLPSSQLSSADTDLARASASQSANDELNAHLSSVQERIQKEELEILALEEMIEELRQARSEWQKQELDRQQRAQADAEASRRQPREHTPQRAFPRASLARAQHSDDTTQQSPHQAGSIADDVQQNSLDNTIDITQRTQDDEDDEQDQIQQLNFDSQSRDAVNEHDQSAISVARPLDDVSVSQTFDDPADLTIQRSREPETHEISHADVADTSAAIDPVPAQEPVVPAASPPQKQPSHLLATAEHSSDELERVTNKVWEVFGEALRSVVPERESADYFDTLDALKSLMSGGNAPHAGDYSVGSVQTSSTLSSAASEASAAVAAQLTPEVLMTAFVIFQMLVSPEPHRMNIDELKLRGHEWWSTAGMQVWLHAQSHDGNDVASRAEAFEDGQNLARKATYGMISKQLFAIKRQKGVGLVGFA